MIGRVKLSDLNTLRKYRTQGGYVGSGNLYFWKCTPNLSHSFFFKRKYRTQCGYVGSGIIFGENVLQTQATAVFYTEKNDLAVGRCG